MTTSEYILNISHEYSTYVMESRAIPSITDGLKQSQRIALWLMKDQVKPVKTAGVVGHMMSSGLYVHGDASAGDALSRLAAPYLNNYPLLQGEGAFGTRTSPVDGIGAPRYTEIRRSKLAEQELYIDIDICPMCDNYDGSKQMPRNFLPRLPLVLLNGIRGIAVGFATNILPRNIDDLRTAVSEVLTDGEVTSRVLPYYTMNGCEIIPDHSKPNRYYIRGIVDIVNTTTVRITEIPPSMSLSTVVARLIELEQTGGIKSFVDNSTDGIDIMVKFARKDLEGMTRDKLLVLFKIITSETENLTVLGPSGDHVIKYHSAQDLITDFVNWRLSLYVQRYEWMIQQENVVVDYERCFLSCFDPVGDSPPVAESINDIETRKDLTHRVEQSILAKSLSLDKSVVDKIVNLPVYRFTKEGKVGAEQKLKTALSALTKYSKIVKSPKRLKSVYLKEI